MKRIWGLVGLLFLYHCAPRKPPPPVEDPKAVEVIADGFESADTVAFLDFNSYLVSHLNDQGNGVISKISKGKKEVFISGLTRPRGISVDPRNGRTYVADGNKIKIYITKKPELPPVEIPVSSTATISEVKYSLINAKTYAIDSEANSVFEIDPASKTAKVLFSPEQKLDRLFVSMDGMRIFMGAGSPAALLKGGLRKKTVDMMQNIPDFERISGIEYFMQHLILLDGAKGAMRAVDTANGKTVLLDSFVIWAGHPISFTMDLSKAVVLDQVEGSMESRLLRFHVPFKG